jgi:hypothetical protein
MRFALSRISSCPIASLSLRRLVSLKEEAGFPFPEVPSAISCSHLDIDHLSLHPHLPTLPNNTCMTRRIRALPILLETPASNCNLENHRGCFHNRSTSSAAEEQLQAYSYALDYPSDVDRWPHWRMAAGGHTTLPLLILETDSTIATHPLGEDSGCCLRPGRMRLRFGNSHVCLTLTSSSEGPEYNMPQSPRKTWQPQICKPSFSTDLFQN